MILNFADARKLAMDHLAAATASYSSLNEELCLIDNKTIELLYGWVFFYEFCHSLPNDMMLGNAPLLVDKHKGQVFVTGTAHSLIYYINEHEKQMNYPLTITIFPKTTHSKWQKILQFVNRLF